MGYIAARLRDTHFKPSKHLGQLDNAVHARCEVEEWSLAVECVLRHGVGAGFLCCPPSTLQWPRCARQHD